MAVTSKWGIYSDDPGQLALGNTQDTRQSASIEAALDMAVESASFTKSQTLGASLTGDMVGAGAYPATNAGAASEAGMPDAYPGTLLSYPVGTSGGLQQFFSLRGGVWERNKVNREWGAWKKSGAQAPTVLSSSSSIDTVIDQTSVITNTSLATTLGLPDAYPGVLIFHPVGAKGGLQSFTSLRGGTWERYKVNNVWGEWSKNGAAAAAGDSSAPVRRELLQQGLRARKGGRIGTGGKGVIALRFDDYHAEFREKVLPLLKERGLPFTRVSTAKTIHDEVIPESELTAMQTYSLDAGGEVWNHGMTHDDASGDAAIATELIGSLAELRSKLPRLPIDCFAPPGGAVTYGGYMPSNKISNYAETTAGQQLFGHHALVTGYFKDSYYWPLDGELKDGLTHYSADTFTLSRATQYIGWARDWRVGIVLMWHSRPFDTPGKMSLADFTAFLDALAAARDAGEVEVLTVSGMAVADKGTAARDDLLTTHSASSSFSEAVTYPQYRKGICGSTRVLTATVTGATGTVVTSTVGESSKTTEIPAGGVLKLWHAATIPTDVTALKITIDKPCTDVHLYAV